MKKKLLTVADIPQIEYRCVCGGEASMCSASLLCENCRRPCKSDPPVTGQKDPQDQLRARIQYAKHRRKHRHCFECKYIKALFIDVECTNPEMKKKVPKGGK